MGGSDGVAGVWINKKTGERAGNKKGPDWENWVFYDNEAKVQYQKMENKRQEQINAYERTISNQEQIKKIDQAWNNSAKNMNELNEIQSKGYNEKILIPKK